MPIGAVAVRLLLSALLSGIIGLERESRGHPAGLRTHLLVGVGSSLITLAGIYGFPGDARDPARLAAQIVSGIGFLGAGTILRDGVNIKGLTTAASLWVVSGVGIATGCGFVSGALIATFLTVISLVLLSRFETRFLPGGSAFVVEYTDNSVDIPELLELFSKHNVPVTNLSISRGKEYGNTRVAVSIGAIDKGSRDALLDHLSKLNQIQSVSLNGFSRSL